MSKLESWYAASFDSNEVRNAQAHLDAMLPHVRSHLESTMQCPPGEETLALLFALTCRADQLDAVPMTLRVHRVDLAPHPLSPKESSS